VRAGSDWCTLCYTDLRPVPATPVAPEPATPSPTAGSGTLEPTSALPTVLSAEHHAGAGDPPPTPTAAVPTPPVRRGKHARRAPDADKAQAETDALAAQLLAQLAVEESGSPLGALTGLTESTGKKAALMIGGAGAVIVVLIALMALVGALV
jgi:hypothetical protein